MVKPLYRSRSYKKLYRKTPGGITVVHYKRTKNTPMRCGVCGTVLAGVPIKDSERRTLPRTYKRPERMFGGVLCPRCLRSILKKVIRSEVISLLAQSTS